MDFSLNDMQQMMQESAARFVRNEYDFESRRNRVASELGYSEKSWSLFAELGWLALPIAQEFGGLGGNLVDCVVLQQELGKGLVVEPYYSNILLCANLVQKLATPSQQQALLEPMAAGELKLALAIAERDVLETSETTTLAQEMDTGYLLNGHKAVVLGAQSANQLLVVAKFNTQADSAARIGVFIVDPSQQGVSLRGYPTNDGHRAADVYLEDVWVAQSNLLGANNNAAIIIQSTINEAIVSLCAEAVGAMDKLLEATTEYVKVREQFGQKISQFQVVQHRLADMFMECELARSMLYYAAMNLQQECPQAQKIASMLKVKIGNSARLVGQQAVQLHGGMGVTDELAVGHYFKRLTAINSQLGSKDYHLNRLVCGRF